MIYVPKVAHTNFSIAYLLRLCSPERSIGHRQHPSTLSCLELAFPVDTTCTSLSSISVRRCSSSVTHVWSTSILPIIIEGACGLKTVVCDEGRSLVFHLVFSPVGSTGVPAGRWKFSVFLMVNPSPSPYNGCRFVFFQSFFRIFSVRLNFGIRLKRLLVLSMLSNAFSKSTKTT